MPRYFNFLLKFRLFFKDLLFLACRALVMRFAVSHCSSLTPVGQSRGLPCLSLVLLQASSNKKHFFYSSHSRQVLLKSSCWVSFSSTVTVGLDLNVQRCQWYLSLYSLLHKWKLNTVILLNSIIWCLRDCACILMLTRYVWSFHLIKLMSYLIVWLAPKFKYFKKRVRVSSQLASQAWI